MSNIQCICTVLTEVIQQGRVTGLNHKCLGVEKNPKHNIYELCTGCINAKTVHLTNYGLICSEEGV